MKESSGRNPSPPKTLRYLESPNKGLIIVGKSLIFLKKQIRIY
jgi:hypothetical protein